MADKNADYVLCRHCGEYIELRPYGGRGWDWLHQRSSGVWFRQCAGQESPPFTVAEPAQNDRSEDA